MSTTDPPGHPGIIPNWTSSAKSGTGTSFPCGSRVWFTISSGIINEVYYPDGEHADGSPYDGTGIGRGWPLLADERAHNELAVGNISKAKYLLFRDGSSDECKWAYSRAGLGCYRYN